MKQQSKIYVAGHRGLVGSAIIRNLISKGYQNIITRTHSELDLTDQIATGDFFAKEKPDYVFLAAAKVGGIYANNTYPAEFIFQNLMIQTNVINSAYLSNVKKLAFLGSSCIYPKFASQPMSESELLTGKLEPTNDAYAIAKIAGIKMCKAYNKQYGTNYISLMPTNLYGLGDNYHLENSHVIPAMIRKIHEAKAQQKEFVNLWGTGKPFREFLYSEDMADACVYLMENINADETGEIINIGTGQDISIHELARLVSEVIGYEGKVIFDVSKPDGTPKKLLNIEKLTQLGWKHKTALKEGIEHSYKDFLVQYSSQVVEHTVNKTANKS